MWRQRALSLSLAACAASPCAPTRSTAPPATASAAAPVRAPAPSAPAPVQSARVSVGRIVASWDTAHAKRDARALDAVYAPEVWFYGFRLSRAQCEKKKAAAFAAAPDDTPSIEDVAFMDDGAGGFFVTLTKVTTSAGKRKRHPAYLYIDEGYVIAEGDGKAIGDHLSEHRCVTVTPDSWFVPHEVAEGPWRVSALQAVRTTMASKHLAEMRAKFNARWIKASIVSCPVKSDRAYHLQLVAPDVFDSHLLGVAHVDGISGQLTWTEYVP
jgi:hypothetical protein